MSEILSSRLTGLPPCDVRGRGRLDASLNGYNGGQSHQKQRCEDLHAERREGTNGRCCRYEEERGRRVQLGPFVAEAARYICRDILSSTLCVPHSERKRSAKAPSGAERVRYLSCSSLDHVPSCCRLTRSSFEKRRPLLNCIRVSVLF